QDSLSVANRPSIHMTKRCTYYLNSRLPLLLLIYTLCGISQATERLAAETAAGDAADALWLSGFWQSAQQQGASRSATEKASQLLSQTASEEIASWLNGGGAHARVTLGTGLQGRDREMGLDYLYPFYHSENHTLFTQLSAHRWAERNIVNMGAGWRHMLTPDLLVGGNLFYDQDLTRHHSRLGAGLELGGKRLQGAFNYYLPLSDWRLSPEAPFTDAVHYDQYERAARGWDINLQLALSSHVALKSGFFQWYGDKVDINGQRQQASEDPHGFELGINWQPLPLLALRGERRFISNQNDDTRVGMELNWQFGRSWREMLDPERASAMPSLNQSRTAFVQRNNNIVLAYKAQAKNWRIYFDPAEVRARAGSAAVTNRVKGNAGAVTRYTSSDPLKAPVDQMSGRVTPLQKGSVTVTAETYITAADTTPVTTAHYQLMIGAGDFAPSVSDVDIAGEPLLGNTLTGSYRYHDNEGEAEGATKLQWYRLDSPSQALDQLQPVAQGEHYQVTTADFSKYIAFQVTPVSVSSLQGSAQSKTVTGPTQKLVGLSFSLQQGDGVIVNDSEVKLAADSTGSLLFRIQVTDAQGKPLAGRDVWWSQRAGAPGQLAQPQSVTNAEGYAQVDYTAIHAAGEDTVSASLQPPSRRDKSPQRQQQARAFKVVMVQPDLALAAAGNPTSVVVGSSALVFNARLSESNNLGINQRTLQWRSNGQSAGTSETSSTGESSVSLKPPAEFGEGQWRVETILQGGATKSLTLTLLRQDVAPLVSNPASVSVTYGAAAQQLTITGGNSATKMFRSSNSAVVSVDSDGRLTFLSAGSATITVSQPATSTEQAPAPLTVPVTVGKSAGTPLRVESLTLYVGETKPLGISGGNNGPLSFSTPSVGVFTVSADARLTALTSTNTTVSLTITEAESENYLSQKYTISVMVKRYPAIPLQGPSAVSVNYGSAAQQLNITGGNVGGKTVYTSFDSAVVQVSDSGLMTFLKGGNTQITVSQPATVSHDAPEKLIIPVTVKKNAGTPLQAKDMQLTVYDSLPVTLSGGNRGQLAYYSSDSDKIAVSSSGVVTARKGTGSQPVAVTVTEKESDNYLGQSTVFNVTAALKNSAPLQGPEPITVDQGAAAQQLNITGGNNGGALTFHSHNLPVVKVTSDGVMTFGGTGISVITVSQAATEQETSPTPLNITVTVKAVVPPVLSWRYTGFTGGIYPDYLGGRFNFTANVTRNGQPAEGVAVCLYRNWNGVQEVARGNSNASGDVSLYHVKLIANLRENNFEVKLCP
ncbi:inverse autotransporter beta domain-containing protein, partial [Erwinia sp. V71]|uniref:inverse autotransporter beta domain-containing protein n=1 Tax=Erwinia sp. V71 TaxID=3369424 RepID=UPI003F6235D8